MLWQQLSFQNLFKLFNKFSGMTGTGKLGEKEFFELYSKIVIQIPNPSSNYTRRQRR
ncbi:hypothetical protein ACWTWI_08990 [Staphylococcus hominis]